MFFRLHLASQFAKGMKVRCLAHGVELRWQSRLKYLQAIATSPSTVTWRGGISHYGTSPSVQAAANRRWYRA
jgi:hypothetical protein